MYDLYMTIRAALIPHAGKAYAGDARDTVFSLLPRSTTHIIYLAAVHRLIPGEAPYLLHDDGGFAPPSHLRFASPSYREHSFDWVEPELRDKFPRAKVIAIGPNDISMELVHWITWFIRSHDKSVLLATTDLIHYGKEFDNVDYLRYPHQLSKEKNEEELIEALVSAPIHPGRVASILKSDSQLTCGHVAVMTFARVIHALGFTGKVVDYYDSHGAMSGDILDRYSVDSQRVDSFVSYVSIVYGKGVRQSVLVPFDIMQAIGSVKSNVAGALASPRYKADLPTWSPFHDREQGVFVGTGAGEETNCSYGRYEGGGGTTADKITEAARDCPKDASERWRRPYDSGDLGRYNYKVELLDPKREWKSYPGKEAIRRFKMDGKRGMFLRLPSGGAATYLPVVARENKDWTKEEYMRHLTRKAGGKGDEWKDGRIKVYSTHSYTWNPESQAIEVS